LSTCNTVILRGTPAAMPARCGRAGLACATVPRARIDGRAAQACGGLRAFQAARIQAVLVSVRNVSGRIRTAVLHAVVGGVRPAAARRIGAGAGRIRGTRCARGILVAGVAASAGRGKQIARAEAAVSRGAVADRIRRTAALRVGAGRVGRCGRRSDRCQKELHQADRGEEGEVTALMHGECLHSPIVMCQSNQAVSAVAMQALHRHTPDSLVCVVVCRALALRSRPAYGGGCVTL